MNVYPEYSPRNLCDSLFEVLLIIVEAGCNFVGVIVFIFISIFILVLFCFIGVREASSDCL
jgi:hypothetical protein